MSRTATIERKVGAKNRRQSRGVVLIFSKSEEERGNGRRGGVKSEDG